MAAAFLLLFLHDRKRTAALHFSGAFFCATVGYTQILLIDGDLRRASVLVTMVTAFGSYVLLLKGMSRLHKRPFPLLLFLLPCVVAVGFFAASKSDPAVLGLRIAGVYGFMVVVDIMCGVIAWRSAAHHIDRVIAVIFLCQAAVISLLVGQLLMPGAEKLNMATFGASHFAITMRTANALFGIALGIGLFVRFGVIEVERLTRLAGTDPLTGLLNRRAFETAAQTLRSVSEPLPTGLIVCDIDHFKRINDNYGHEVGDRTLMAFAKLLVEEAPDTAICTRLGGEEFCVLLTGATAEMTQLVATRLRVAIEQMQLGVETGQLTLTASFGWCELAPADDLRAAMANADAAVYQAKNDGRNLVRMAG